MAQKQNSNQFNFTREMLPVDRTTPPVLAEYRLQAWEAFQRAPYPTRNDEAWRRTSLRPLRMGNLHLPNQKTPEIETAPLLDQYLDPLTKNRKGGQAILTPKNVTIELASNLEKLGVIFTDLITAAKKHPQLLKKVLGKIVSPNDGKFAALTGAFAKNGVFIYIPGGVQVDQTLHSLSWNAGEGLAHFSNLLIYLEKGASLTYIHETTSPKTEKEQSLIGENIEIHVGQGANLKFIELQTLSRNQWSFGHQKAHIERDGNLDWVIGGLGSRLTKHFLTVDLVAPGAEGKISGLYFANRNQHLSYNTRQNHLAPRTYSNLLFKGGLTETSRTVWRGMIYVSPGSQHIDGYQNNRNLMLSEDAHADSIPGLEILNDEVRCSHGATVGKIDPEQLFYLQARGIPLPEAERLIVYGFFDEILQRIPLASVKKRLEQKIHQKLEN